MAKSRKELEAIINSPNSTVAQVEEAKKELASLPAEAFVARVKDSGQRSNIAAWDIADLNVGTLSYNESGASEKGNEWVRFSHQNAEREILFTSSQLQDLADVAPNYCQLKDGYFEILAVDCEKFQIKNKKMSVLS